MRDGDRAAGPPAEPSIRGVGGSALGIFVTTAAGLAGTFLTYVVIARALGPDGRGVVAVLQTDAVIVASLLGLGVPWALFYYAGHTREPQPALLGISLVHGAALAVAAVGLGVLLGPTLAQAQDLPDDLTLFVVAAVLVPATFLEYAYLDMLRGHRRFRLANGIVLAGRGLGLVATLVLVTWLALGVRGALIALVAGSIAQVLAALPVLASRGVGLSRSVARQVRRYGLRVQGASVSRLLSRRLDIVILSLFAPSAVVGHYAVAQSLAELALLVPQAFGLAVSPLITSREAGPRLTHRLIRVNGAVALVVVAALAATAPWSVVLAFGEDFEPAVVPLLILLPGLWMFACGELVSHVLAARGRPGTASLLSALQAVLTIALDVVLIPAYGIHGAAAASAVAYCAYGVASVVVIGRHDGVAPARLLLATPREVRAYAGALRAAVTRG